MYSSVDVGLCLNLIPVCASSMPFSPLGSTLLARHALERYGWNVVVLPWYEWATTQVGRGFVGIQVLITYKL
jgi:hypothetical protein